MARNVIITLLQLMIYDETANYPHLFLHYCGKCIYFVAFLNN